MSQAYKISENDLLVFAKKLYQQACMGSPDRCDAVATRTVLAFLEGQEKLAEDAFVHDGTGYRLRPGFKLREEVFVRRDSF